MSDVSPIRRHWFRFSLRTMLVLVTLVCILCGYLSWAFSWIRQREAFVKYGILTVDPKFKYPAPMLIRIVGARGYNCLIMPNVTEQHVAEAKRLFPEAALIYDEAEEATAYKAD